MKAGDKLRTMTLRGVLAEISRYEVEKAERREADESAIIHIVKRERARREEALEFARKGNRADLIAQNETEARILDEYLPSMLTADELKQAIARQIEGGSTQMGAIMKALKDTCGTRYDG